MYNIYLYIYDMLINTADLDWENLYMQARTPSLHVNSQKTRFK